MNIIENINQLRMISLVLLILSVVFLLFALIVAKRNNLYEYYQIRRGKSKRQKQNKIEKQNVVSQYYSEPLQSDDTHEILNASEILDDTSDLNSSSHLGENFQGILNQVIDDDDYSNDNAPSTANNAQEDVDSIEETTILPQNHNDDGVEETTILPKNNLENGEEETTLLSQQEEDEDGAEATTLLDETQFVDLPSDGEEETSLLDETDMVPLGEDVSEESDLVENLPIPTIDDTHGTHGDEGIDETAVLKNSEANDSGEEETTLLDSNSSEKTNKKKPKRKPLDYWGPRVKKFVLSSEKHVNAIVTTEN